MKARVFISCGQNKSSDEPIIADAISKNLIGMGFDPYVAVRERTLRGVKENIFSRLAESEYFLFVDFKREVIAASEHRGSLFCHQEFAIAAFLEKRVLVFQEQGVRKLDGIMAFVQANAIEFTDRNTLPSLVQSTVASSDWRNDWRDELWITRDLSQHVDEQHEKGPVRYWHVTVENRNPYKTAFQCHAYLRSLVRIEPNPQSLSFEVVEYKWRGVGFPSAIVPPLHRREFDAFLVYRNQPGVALAGTHTDSPRHLLRLMQPSKYVLTFCVYSESFHEARRDFYLDFPGSSVDAVVFRETTEAESNQALQTTRLARPEI